mmetsp:Transcript_16162/g.50083  ORF Transcript_16162/g.50083 Transcript_16162/m.50083 type:complete len:264 (+) Transcript_16162:712-1503(+)
MLAGGHPWVHLLAAGLPHHRFVSGSQDGSLKVWELSDDGRVGRCLHTLLGHTHHVLCLEVLPDGIVLSGSNDTSVRVWDAIAGHCLQTLSTGASLCFVDPIYPLPDGRVLAYSAQTIHVWEIATGRQLWTLDLHEDVNEVAVLGGGRVIVSVTDNCRALYVWYTTADGDVLFFWTLKGHKANIHGVAALPGGRVASSSVDGVIKIWDVSQRRCLQTLTGHANEVSPIVVLVDGRLVSLDDDGIAKIWYDRSARREDHGRAPRR